MWAPGGWGDRGIERDHELHVQQHLRLAIDAIRSQLGRGTARVILAGPPEVRAMFTALAPKPLRERIVGELHIPLFASPEEVRDAAVATIAAAERRSEDELIQEMAEKEGRGQAIFGAEAVGRAIVDGQAALLVYAGTAEIAGAACAICGTVMVGQGDHAAARCPRCDGAMDPVADLIDLLAHRIVAQGGRTEEVRGEAAERLTARGGVGAILRYPVPA
jgi:peptide subunit release factor 1 (eRF1)